MANTNAPSGFKASRLINGAAPNYAFSPGNDRSISSANTTAIGFGDVITELSTGYIALSLTTDAPIFGIFQGCTYFDTGVGQWQFNRQWPGVTTASAAPKAHTIADTKQIFEVQSSGAAIVLSNIGLNANFTSNGAPNAITGISTASLDQTTISTTNTLPFRIVGLGQAIGNDNTTSYNAVEVILNDSSFNQLTGI